MELHGVVFRGGIFHRRDGVRCAADDRKSLWQSLDVVAVAVPDFDRVRHSGKKRGATFDFELRGTIFASLDWTHVSAEHVRHPLHTVANPQHRHAEPQHFGIARRSILVVDRARSARKNDSNRLPTLDLLHFRVAWEHGGEDFLLADAPGDQLRILPAKIEYDDALFDAQRFPFTGGDSRVSAQNDIHKFLRHYNRL